MTNFKLVNAFQYTALVAFTLLISLSPSIIFIPYIDPHDCQRLIQLVLLSCVLLDVIVTWQSALPINKKLRLAFFILLGLAIASAWRAIEPRYAIIEMTVFAALCYLALMVGRLYVRDKEILVKRLTYALIIGVALNLFLFYVGYLSAMISGRGLTWPEPITGFSSIRVFCQYQLLTLAIVCLPLLVFDLEEKATLCLYVALTSWWILIYYAASRGVILSWLVAMVATAIVYKKQAWPFLRMQLINAATGLGGYLVLFKAVPSWVASTAATAVSTGSAIVTSTVFRDTVSDRTDLWNAAFEMIKIHPVFGVGPMHFYFYNPFGTHPHNSILQIAAEWGLPATLIILAIAGYGFYCWYKKFNSAKLQAATKLDNNLAIILFFTVIANGAYSFVDGVIVMPISQVLMFTMIGLMIGQYTEGNWLTVNHQATKIKLRFRPVFAGVVLIALVLSTLPELVRGLTSNERHLAPGERAFSMAPNTINPRIWMQQRRVEPEANKQNDKDAH